MTDTTSTLHSQRTLIQGATVLSMDPAIGDLARGDVLVEGDTIVAVGPDLTDRAAGATVVDARGTIALPGFVDSHVHAWEGQLRGVGPDVDFGGYLGLTAFGFGPHYRPEDMYAGTLATAVVALDGGITTVVDNAHNALTPDHSRAGIEALRDAGLRGVHAVGAPFGSELAHVPGVAPRLQEEYAGPLTSVRLFEVNPSADLWAFADEHGLWVSTELGTHTPYVDEVMEQLHGKGLLTTRHTFNHAYDLGERTWDLIAEAGATVNVAPRSDAAFGLGSTVLPIDHALSRGVSVGVSGDNEISYGLSMFSELQNLNSRHRSEVFRRHAAGGPLGEQLTAHRLLHLATQGGADNAGLGDVVGSLTPGKQADLVLVDAGAVNTHGVADPAALVTAFAHAGNVDTVLVAGRLQKRHGRLVGCDLDRVRSLVEASRGRLLAAAGR